MKNDALFKRICRLSVAKDPKMNIFVFSAKRVKNSHFKVFYLKGVLQNFAKCIGKHLYQSFFSISIMPTTINDIRSRLPTPPTEKQSSIQNINSTYSNAVIPKEKNIALFSDSILRGIKMKHLNYQVKEGRTHLKAFSGIKANQLNHYVVPTLEEFDHDCAIILVGINNIL